MTTKGAENDEDSTGRIHTCRILTLLVLAVFYGIYLIKQWGQKRRGIQTMQFGHGKDTQTRTLFRSGAVFLCLFFSPFLLDGKSNGGGESPLSAAVHCGGRLVGFSSVDEIQQGLPVKAKRNSKLRWGFLRFCYGSGIYKTNTFFCKNQLS